MTIGPGESRVLDADINANIITVHGTLSCGLQSQITVNLDQLVIDGGKFECGSSKSDPFAGQIRFNFKGTKDNPSIHVKNSGQLIMHGHTRVAWERLQETALVGASRIKLPSTIDWNVGEEIVIAPSDFIFDAYEVFTIKGLEHEGSFVWLTLNGTLVHPHYGQTQTVNGMTLESRAEVDVIFKFMETRRYLLDQIRLESILRLIR